MTAPGTLAVLVRPTSLTAHATGPLGGEMGRYENGRLTGKSGETYLLDPELLRGVLAGIWRGGLPAVIGADGEEGLLRWDSKESVAQGVLDLTAARLTSLSVKGRAGELRAEFAGPCDPWPERVSLWDLKAGRSLRLKRLAAEPLAD